MGFWRGRLCLITGAEGFVGAHLAKRLVAEGAAVVALSRQKDGVTSLSLLGADEGLELITGVDVTNYRRVKELFHRYDFDTCFHLAAVSTLPRATELPLKTLETNVRGTWNVLDLARQKRGIRAVIVASTDKVYGDHDGRLPYREDSSALRGVHVYDASKACAEYVSHAYFFQFRVPLRITRCSNVYGPGDLNFSRLIPGTVMRTLRGEEAVIHGGQQEAQREYLYIDDAIDAYIRLAESTCFTNSDWQRIQSMRGEDAFGHCSFNIGGGAENIKSVLQVIEAVRAVVNGDVPAPRTLERAWPTVLDVPQQALDSSKILAERGWAPRVRMVPDGLIRTVKWYKMNAAVLGPLFEESSK